MTSNKAHHLNRTSSLVWSKCDGKTTLEEVTQLVSKDTGTEIGEDFIRLALDELRKANLLDDSMNQPVFPELSRRKALFKYALPTLALPIVVSLAAPEPVYAQSCPGTINGCGNGNMDVNIGGDCDPMGADCCPGLVCVAGIVCGTCQLPTPV